MSMTENSVSTRQSSYNRKPISPKARGWVVTFAGFVGLTISCSFNSSKGIFYTYMIDEYGLSLTSLSFIGSVHAAISFTGAIFGVRVIERFGERPVIMFGGGAFFLGCLLSSFGTSFLILLIGLGFIAGGGCIGYAFGMEYIVEQRYYGRAIALSFLMQGIGNLVGTPIAAILQDLTNNTGIPYYFGTVCLVIPFFILFPLWRPRQIASEYIAI